MIAAVRAAIGSAGSGGGMAEATQKEFFEATEGNNPSKNCHVAYLHNRWVDFNEILTQYSWGLGDVFGHSNVILATSGCHQHHDTVVASLMAPLGCVQCLCKVSRLWHQ